MFEFILKYSAAPKHLGDGKLPQEALSCWTIVKYGSFLIVKADTPASLTTNSEARFVCSLMKDEKIIFSKSHIHTLQSGWKPIT